MRLPDPNNPLEGAVARERVIRVLRAHGAVVLVDADGDFVIRKGERLQVQPFPPMVGRKLVQQLSRYFDISILEFYFDELEDDS